MRIPLRAVRAAVLAGSRPLGRPVPVPVQRAWLEGQAALLRLPAGSTVEREVLGGRPAERVSVPGSDGSRAVLLLHGGSFMTGSPRTHRLLAAHVAASAGCPVHVLDYRLAPEHPWPAAVDDAHAAYRDLAAAGLAPGVLGDSAGGALALLLALRLRDAGDRRPPGLALLSPAADLTLETSRGYRGPDPVLRRSWVRQGVAAFVGAADPRAVSPLHQPLHGLPPVLLHVSTDEQLRPDGERLAAALRAAGVPVEVEVLHGLWHDVHLQAAVVPEAAAAVRRVGAWLQERAGS